VKHNSDLWCSGDKVNYLAIPLEHLVHRLHLLAGQDHRLADLQGAPVLAGQGFHLDGQGQGAVRVGAERDQAVVGEQAGLAVGQRAHRMLRQRRRAERGVVGAADRIAAGHGDHVVHRRDAAAQAGQRGGERGVAVHHGVGVRPGGQDRGVEAPFGGGPAPARRNRAVQAHHHQVVRHDPVIGHAGRRDQHALGHAGAQVAGGALGQPQRGHAPAGVDQGKAQVCVGHRFVPCARRVPCRPYPPRRRTR